LAISVWLRPGIFVEQQQHRELRRGQLQWRHAAQKILEDFQLRALERIAEQFGQFAHLQRRVFRTAFGRLLAGGAQRLDGIGGGLGNSHRSKLAIPLGWNVPASPGLRL